MKTLNSSSPIRILNVTKSTGGLAYYNLRLCELIDKDKYRFDIICLSEGNHAYAAKLRELGFEASSMDMEVYSINVWTDLQLIWKLYWFVRAGNYSLLVGHGSKAGFLMRLVGRLTSVPAIYGLHTMSFLPRIQGWRAYIYLLLEYFASFIGGHIVTLSNSTKETLTRLKIAREDQISVIYSGINLTSFSDRTDLEEAKLAMNLDPSRPVVGWAGRFVPQKSPLDFVKAMEIVCSQDPDIQIFMAGEGPLKAEIENLIKDLELENNFVLAPWQSNVPLMLSAFDVYVLNSSWEGMPLSLLEAMAMGLPTVATNVDGTSEVVNHGMNGYLISPGDVSQLADFTISLLNEPELRNTMGHLAHQRINSNHSSERMIQEWEELFLKHASGTLKKDESISTFSDWDTPPA